MDMVATGPSHSAALSVKKVLYCWGFNSSGNLGLNPKETKKAFKEPVLVSYIDEIMQKNKNNFKEGLREGNKMDDDEDENNSPMV